MFEIIIWDLFKLFRTILMNACLENQVQIAKYIVEQEGLDISDVDV